MLHPSKLHLAVASLALIGSVAVAGCGRHSTGPDAGRHIRTFSPPERSFATRVGVTGGPITDDQARQIAVEAAGGGTALSVEREDMDGTEVFGVQVQTASDVKDVKIQISDGAVTQIEEGGPDGSGGETGRD